MDHRHIRSRWHFETAGCLCMLLLLFCLFAQVVGYLQGNSSSLRAFRRTCKNWRTCADATMQALAPSALLPKDLVRMFPVLQVWHTPAECFECSEIVPWAVECPSARQQKVMLTSRQHAVMCRPVALRYLS